MKATLRVIAFIAAIGAIFAFAAPAQAQRGVIGHFGEAGSGDGQIGYGHGIAVNGASGALYVADLLSPRVEHFDTEGNFEGAFGWGVDDGAEEAQICTSGCQAGNPGAGAGQFASGGPGAVAVDEADGSVYVLDTGNFRIEKFDADGNFELAFGWGVADGAEELQSCAGSCQSGIPGSGSGQLNENMYNAQLAVDPTSGDVLLTDALNQRVQEFSPSGGFVRTFGRDVEEGGGEGFEVCAEAAKCKPGQPGEEAGAFPAGQPFGIAVDDDGSIYVADQSPARVQKFVPAAGTLEPPASAISLGETIFGFTLDRSTGHLVVLDQDPAHSYFFRAEEFDASGNFVQQYLGGLKTYAVAAIGFDPVTGQGYAIANEHTVYVIGELAAPEVTIGPATDVTATTATVHGSVNSQGEPPAHYHFEYSLEGSGEWISTSDGTVPGDNSDHPVSAELTPPGGLEPNSTYLVRLVAEKSDNDPVTSAEVSFSTGGAAPLVETVGSPFRTASTARLDSRINARGAATTYRFEYGLTSAYGSSAPAGAEAEAGTSQRSILVSQQVTGLQPGTTYHYRVVAENAFGIAVGEDMTVTTRAGDQPLTHGHFPGPPGSDRAYEQVNMADTGGNPVTAGFAISDDGSRVVYNVYGGTPGSDHGTLANQFFAERTDHGWESSSIWPGRSQATGSSWEAPITDSGLNRFFAHNFQPGFSQWELEPGRAARKIIELPAGSYANFYLASEDISRVVVRMKGTMDPDHPVATPDTAQLYDVTDGSYHLVSLLPDGSPPTCGVPMESTSFNLPLGTGRRSSRWMAADGSRMFFPAIPHGDCGDAETTTQVFMRDFEAGVTKAISGSPISGRECTSAFIKANADEAYFWTQSRLDPADTAPSADNCSTFSIGSPGQGDVYKYRFSDGAISCVTCVIPDADVGIGGGNTGADTDIAISDDGSRIYFYSPRRLVEGEGTPGGYNVYRLAVASGHLKFVSPVGPVGDVTSYSEAITPDGSVIVFKGSDPRLNALTNSDNGGQDQFYRYDDRDGSLVCASCPSDGSPGGQVGGMPIYEAAPNTVTLDEKGDLVFITSAPLAVADQNTSQAGESPLLGNDVYEWRDGRTMLITTGMTRWPGNFLGSPRVVGITPDGRDVFFTTPEQLTADALDGFSRLYDARIGGGFEFPKPPPPCPLEICQGEAPPAPRNPAAGSIAVNSDGNLPPSHKKRKKCGQGKAKKKRCAHHGKKKIDHKKNKKNRNSHKTGGAR